MEGYGMLSIEHGNILVFMANVVYNNARIYGMQEELLVLHYPLVPNRTVRICKRK